MIRQVGHAPGRIRWNFRRLMKFDHGGVVSGDAGALRQGKVRHFAQRLVFLESQESKPVRYHELNSGAAALFKNMPGREEGLFDLIAGGALSMQRDTDRTAFVCGMA